MKRSFICCYRDKPAPQLWMQPGWHMLLDIFLHHCWQVFQQDHLGTVEGLEAALQQQITSRVSRLASIRCLLNISTLTPKPLDSSLTFYLGWKSCFIAFHYFLISSAVCSLMIAIMSVCALTSWSVRLASYLDDDLESQLQCSACMHGSHHTCSMSI